YINVDAQDWVTNGVNYHFYNQLWGQKSYDHTTCVVQHKRIKLNLKNGYEIVYKSVKNKGIPSDYVEKKWFVDNKAPFALALAHSSPNDSDGNGCYLNSWYVEPDEGQKIGHPSQLNHWFESMSQPGWPSLYFSGSESGRYDAATWAYWPFFTSGNTNDKKPYHYVSKYNNEVTIQAYQLHVPNSSSIYWGKYCKPTYPELRNSAKIQIIDNYGNSGEFYVNFNADINASVTVS
ncbi:hypothetical protein AB204_17325, partial [Xenorhabdus khoisanae]